MPSCWAKRARGRKGSKRWQVGARGGQRLASAMLASGDIEGVSLQALFQPVRCGQRTLLGIHHPGPL